MKKNVKKILSLVLSLAMVLTMSACGSKSSSDNGDKPGSDSNTSGETTGNPITIKIGTVHYEGSVGIRALEAMKDYLETNSNGRITVEVYPGGVLGDHSTMLEMLEENDIQMDVVNPVGFETQIPTMALLNNYYAFDDLDHLHRFMEGEGGQFIMDAWSEIGMHGLAWLSLGFRELYNNARPIKSVEDMKGLSIRGYSTIQIATWKSVGVDPVSVDWNELFVSLQQKLINGEEGAICNYQDYSFYEVAKNFTYTDHVMGTDMVICTEKWYNSLSEEDRALVDEASKICYEYHRDHYIPENEELMQKLVAEQGVQVNELDPAVKAQLAEKMSAASAAEIVKVTGQELEDEYLKLVDAAC